MKYGTTAVKKLRTLQDYLSEKGLKSTRQRIEIAKVFFDCKKHISTEELHHKLQRKNPRIGYATVYRTMRLLKECHLAKERHFGDGQTLYEPISDIDIEHHDHLICTKCAKIIEFENKMIEEMQQQIAKENNFEIFHHKLELYGLCCNCK